MKLASERASSCKKDYQNLRCAALPSRPQALPARQAAQALRRASHGGQSSIKASRQPRAGHAPPAMQTDGRTSIESDTACSSSCPSSGPPQHQVYEMAAATLPMGRDGWLTRRSIWDRAPGARAIEHRPWKANPRTELFPAAEQTPQQHPPSRLPDCICVLGQRLTVLGHLACRPLKSVGWRRASCWWTCRRCSRVMGRQ